MNNRQNDDGQPLAASTGSARRVAFIDGSRDAACELCGKVDELRPYGPNGEAICFECGMKDEKTTAAQFAKILNGNDTIIIK